MGPLFISYLDFISYYGFVGLPGLDVSVDFHQDLPIDVAHVAQSLVGPTKKLGSYTLVMTSNQLLRLYYTDKIETVTGSFRSQK